MRSWSSVLAVLAACGGPLDGSEPADSTPVEPIELEVAASLAESVPTVVRVSVTASRDDQAIQVAFGENGAFDRTAPVVDGQAVLFGLPQNADIALKAVAEGGESEPVTVSTGTLEGAPAPSLDGSGFGKWAALPVMSDQETWAVLLDPQGRVTWAWRDRSGLATFRARVARDGSGVVYNRANAGPDPGAALVRVTWEGEETVIPLPELAHDFVEQADGTVVTLGYTVRDGTLANTLVQVDPSGGTTELWSAFDCLDPVANPGDDPQHGWTHANALDEDEDGGWLVGMRNLSTILKVDPDGTCPWALGGTGGTLEVAGQVFQHQHQFERVGRRMVVFDNDGAPGNQSRVLEFDLDLAAGTADQVGTWFADPPVVTFILGDVHRMASGDTLVAWSTSSALDVVAPDGSRRSRLSFSGFGRVGFFDLHDQL